LLACPLRGRLSPPTYQAGRMCRGLARAATGGATTWPGRSGVWGAAFLAEPYYLGPLVTTAMALSGYPVGPVNKARIQRVAQAMLQFGFMSRQDASQVEQGTLVAAIVGPAS